MSAAALTLTLCFTDAELDEEERERCARQLFNELRDSDLGEVSRPRGTPPPPGAKSWLTEATAMLTILVGAAGLRPLFDYLIERHRGREMSVEVEIKGKKIKLTARTREDLELVYEAAGNLFHGCSEHG